jgi:hypothetical protein
MTDIDRGKFGEVVTRLARHYNRKYSDAEREGLTRTYFNGLKAWALEDVIRGAERVIETSRRFPLVAEWQELISAARRDRFVPCPTDARQMTPAEILEHERAYALHYEDEPCSCSECVRANVDHLAIRFVPLDDEVAFNPKVGRLVPIGYWLHGEGLGRWYEAKRKFLTSATQAGLKPERLLVLVGAREPGEDG